jgi:hypothetical protein
VVDGWLGTKALQNQDRRRSATKVLIAPSQRIARFYALATAQVGVGDLPLELLRRLPRGDLPVAYCPGSASTRIIRDVG